MSRYLKEVPRRPGLFNQVVTVKCNPEQAIEAYRRRMPLDVIMEPDEDPESGYVLHGQGYGLGILPHTAGFYFLSIASRSKRRIKIVVDTFLRLDEVEEIEVPESYLEAEWEMTKNHHREYGDEIRTELKRALKGDQS